MTTDAGSGAMPSEERAFAYLQRLDITDDDTDPEVGRLAVVIREAEAVAIAREQRSTLFALGARGDETLHDWLVRTQAECNRLRAESIAERDARWQRAVGMPLEEAERLAGVEDNP